jgi:glycosyltransferase involved in cell wall biosynthesis
MGEKIGSLKNLKVYFFVNDVSAYSYYRILSPFRALKRLGFNVKLFSTLQPTYLEDGDVFVFQRISNPDILKFCEWVRKRKKSLIFDMDENFFQISLWNPHSAQLKTIQSYALMTLKFADMVTAPTPFLAAQLKSFNENVYVIPNFIDKNLWKKCEPKKREDFNIEKNEVVIGWAGTEGHIDNLRLIVNAVEEIMDKYTNTRLMLLGFDPGFFDVPSERKISIPFQKYSDYISYLFLMDIAIVPLEENLFNKCKSGVKILEHGMARSAVIASNILPFKNLKNEGALILLCKGDDEWERNLEFLVKEEEERKRFANSLREFVLKKYILEKNLVIYKKLFSRVNKVKTGNKVKAVL